MFTLLPRALTLAELDVLRIDVLRIARRSSTFRLGKSTWTTFEVQRISHANNTLLCAAYSDTHATMHLLPAAYTATHVLSPSLELYTLNQSDHILWDIKHPLVWSRFYPLESSTQHAND